MTYIYGTPMTEIPPEQRGKPMLVWLDERLEASSRAARALGSKLYPKPEDAPLSNVKLWTPRDSYGFTGSGGGKRK